MKCTQRFLPHKLILSQKDNVMDFSDVTEEEPVGPLFLFLFYECGLFLLVTRNELSLYCSYHVTTFVSFLDMFVFTFESHVIWSILIKDNTIQLKGMPVHYVVRYPSWFQICTNVVAWTLPLLQLSRDNNTFTIPPSPPPPPQIKDKWNKTNE